MPGKKPVGQWVRGSECEAVTSAFCLIRKQFQVFNIPGEHHSAISTFHDPDLLFEYVKISFKPPLVKVRDLGAEKTKCS
jgi:hypothetical protein